MAANINGSAVTACATLIDQRSSFAPGDNFLLNVELDNPNHNMINSLSYKQTIRLVNVPHLRGFSIENYRDTLQLTIPNDNSIIPSFHYMPPGCSRHPIAVQFMLKIKEKTNGLFNDFILDLSIGVHSMEMYNYEVALAATL